MEELKRIIDDSEITKEDDALWPPPDRVGRQVGALLPLSGLSQFLYTVIKTVTGLLSQASTAYSANSIQLRANSNPKWQLSCELM